MRLCLIYPEQVEAALGAFYAPAKPLAESVVLDYREGMSRLARRFFHQLLRCVLCS